MNSSRHRSQGLGRVWQMLCLTAAATPLCVFSLRLPASQASPNTPPVNIRENGYFRADLGLFFIEGDRLDVYDGGLDSDVIWDNVSGRLVLLREVEKELGHHGEPFYHEVFQLEHGEWNRKDRDFAQTPKRFLDFGPCDARDQIDLPDEPLAGLDASMRSVLRRGIRIKGVADLGGSLTALVISEMPKELPSIYDPGTYRLRLLLLQKTKQTWHFAANLEVEKWAYYCGMRSVETTLKNGQPATVLLLYSSTPQGSRILSVMRQIDSFLISTNIQGSH